MTTWLILRAGAVIFAAVLYAFAVACIVVYAVRFRQAMHRGAAGRRQDKGRERDFDWIGALPAHVWLGSLALLLWQVPLIGQLVVHFTQPPMWWGLPFVLAGDIGFTASLTSAIWYELRMLR